MLSTLLVLGGVLVGLLVLLALIVSLSARPATVARGTGTGRSEWPAICSGVGAFTGSVTGTIRGGSPRRPISALSRVRR